ncbi:MAG: hypothetical protein KC435_00475 [Thermomicrobiales bacterium]|nr:hypothetical protein [Thermomicrobiales bacterium]
MADAAPFESVLFVHPGEIAPNVEREPACFHDLNLDLVVADLTRDRETSHLLPFFYQPLRDIETLHYRQDAQRDLERSELRAAIDRFAARMEVAERHHAFALKQEFPHGRDRWLHDAMTIYTDAVQVLADQLHDAAPNSLAFTGLRNYLSTYVNSASFVAMAIDGQKVGEMIGAIPYTVNINNGRVTVRKYEEEEDYPREVERTFDRFKEEDATGDAFDNPPIPDAGYVENRVVELVAQLFPVEFAELAAFCQRNAQFMDAVIHRFARDVQFYLSYLDYIAPIRSRGMTFCYPEISGLSRGLEINGGYDIALAAKLAREGKRVVTNDVHLSGHERALVVTGPNQGGKTTFARMIGQMHYLAALGLCVPGTLVRLFLPDQIFCHFDQEERVSTLRSGLENDLMRVHGILDEATAESLVVLNETFSSTMLSDAVYLGKEILQRMLEKGLLCVYVTFIDELASLNDATVSMVAVVDPDDPSRRTFSIVRREADGLAYAAAISKKYGIDYEHLKARITS